MQKTNIEWTARVNADGTTSPGFSANPLKYRRKSDNKIVWGCVKKSAGCSHCYSETIALRWKRGKLFNAANMEELTPFLDDEECRGMRTKQMIDGEIVSGSRCFLADMTDLFGEWVSDDILNRLFSDTLERRTDVTWQILTKRADRMRKYLSWRWGEGRIPCRHIHVGVSVENQKAADERIPLLLQTPAAVRFLSCEPLLGKVELQGHERWYLHFPWHSNPKLASPLHWVIVGGESGHGARPMDIAWARSILNQCKAASVPVFVKQLGSNCEAYNAIDPLDQFPNGTNFTQATGDGARILFRDKKGGDMAEWPADLRVREFPR